MPNRQILWCLPLLSCALFSANAIAADLTKAQIYQQQGYHCDGKKDGRLFAENEAYGYGLWQIRADFNFDGREDILLRDTLLEGGRLW